MGFADRHSKGTKVFDIELEGFEFRSLEELYKQDKGKGEYTLNGFYINKKSQFGAHPVGILEDLEVLVDLPKHMVEDFEDMLHDEEDLEDIKAGRAKFRIEQYEAKKYKKICYGIRWI